MIFIAAVHCILFLFVYYNSAMQKFALILLILSTLLSERVTGQGWKVMRYEVSFGLGGSNYLGELGGADQIGTNQFKDLELTMTRYVVSAGLRYRLQEWLYLKGSLSMGMLSGDDQLTQDPSRNYRNLSFKSPIYEFAVQIEAAFKTERLGAIYNIPGVRGRRWYSLNIYPFVGIAGFYMNPKGEYNNIWYALQPLTTEGQGEFETREKYSRFQLAIPIGLGFKYGFNRRWSLSFEYGLRKTFTDYIDDVSTTYVHEDFIANGASVNKQAAIGLANKGDGGLGQNGSSPSQTAPGAQRGDPHDNDSYMFAILSINYRFRKLKRLIHHKPKF